MMSENLSQSTVPSLTAAIAAAKGRVDRIILLENLHFLFCWLWKTNCPSVPMCMLAQTKMRVPETQCHMDIGIITRGTLLR